MKRRILTSIILILCLALCICLVSCGDEGESATTTTAPSTAGTEPHSHTFGEWTTTQEKTCTSDGVREQRCACGEKNTEVIVASHTEETVAGKEATCLEGGLTEGKRCTACGQVLVSQEAIEAKGHSYGDDNVCTACGDVKEVKYVRVDDDTIQLGSYPQTRVNDEELVKALNSLAGDVPSSRNDNGWTSYGYYANGEIGNFMWYIDVENEGERYRGVYFTAYRPDDTSKVSSESNTYQYGNDYYTSIVYWFKYEPISWTILAEESGRAFLLCDMIIDAQEYYVSQDKRTENGADIYASNYAYSTIRAWLNDNFYNTAFSEIQREIIVAITVDNSASSTEKEPNSYACEDTEDKIFLLSKKEISTYLTEAELKKQTTDYSECQGAYSDITANGCGWWRTRSPFYFRNFQAGFVDAGGRANSGGSGVTQTSYGVAPALWIIL